MQPVAGHYPHGATQDDHGGLAAIRSYQIATRCKSPPFNDALTRAPTLRRIISSIFTTSELRSGAAAPTQPADLISQVRQSCQPRYAPARACQEPHGDGRRMRPLAASPRRRCGCAQRWLKLETHRGPEAIVAAYRTVLKGDARPDVGIICRALGGPFGTTSPCCERLAPKPAPCAGN